ncbi:hypothetical protein [Lysinibacillus sp. fls2-241-R2A-57]|uniref:hypothetical protein n=1 Tax=Lysinibacillus sp. fls2-241-R2A-57 TaxID=3040292 RepID=UPI002556BA1C|nr:hypothetical protein [Lysinibacillus sp. fls2-241-R2A-57]
MSPATFGDGPYKKQTTNISYQFFNWHPILKAVFVGAYSKAVERLNSKSTKSLSVEDKTHRNVQYLSTIG